MIIISWSLFIQVLTLPLKIFYYKYIYIFNEVDYYNNSNPVFPEDNHYQVLYYTKNFISIIEINEQNHFFFFFGILLAFFKWQNWNSEI